MSSKTLTEAEILEFLNDLPGILSPLLSSDQLQIQYGFGTNLHSDLWYVPMRVSLQVFPYFIEDSVTHRIFELGGSDLIIGIPNTSTKIVACHESDVHLDGENLALISQIAQSFPKLDFRTAEAWKQHFASNNDETPSGPTGI